MADKPKSGRGGARPGSGPKRKIKPKPISKEVGAEVYAVIDPKAYWLALLHADKQPKIWTAQERQEAGQNFHRLNDRVFGKSTERSEDVVTTFVAHTDYDNLTDDELKGKLRRLLLESNGDSRT